MNASEHETGESNIKLPPSDDGTTSSYSRVEREKLPEGSRETAALRASYAKADVSRRPDPKVQAAKKGRRVWKKPEVSHNLVTHVCQVDCRASLIIFLNSIPNIQTGHAKTPSFGL
jgi:hypothetical protein